MTIHYESKLFIWSNKCNWIRLELVEDELILSDWHSNHHSQKLRTQDRSTEITMIRFQAGSFYIFDNRRNHLVLESLKVQLKLFSIYVQRKFYNHMILFLPTHNDGNKVIVCSAASVCQRCQHKYKSLLEHNFVNTNFQWTEIYSFNIYV